MEMLLLSQSYKARPLSINFRGSSGETPLHTAATVALLEVVEQLLEAGADPNITDFGNGTPLHYVVNSATHPEEVFLKLTEVLVEGGADPRLRDSTGRKPVDIAAKHRRTFNVPSNLATNTSSSCYSIQRHPVSRLKRGPSSSVVEDDSSISSDRDLLLSTLAPPSRKRRKPATIAKTSDSLRQSSLLGAFVQLKMDSISYELSREP
ncbi:hypothetical protein ACJZ2D_013790 [Fusarium nematophilum]